ncbi:serine/threonine-protein phosphatase [Marivirga sp. S37H4]|uniref:Serine/threonine-protein phosphatase n=1 Tax=Marivirga aurantiaca TaxID=2802615 RepID=A0A935CA39_9BACT|nr:PP2C family protein-serine/threonine phosphatase [Marivirga aurantiaca]MBK6266319.1 serine/threonine-protein phosphatase [Marivirga aurantiaca]
MDTTYQISNQYELKELELNSLLEITQAINDNLSEESLYKIYNFTLRANLRLAKLLLLVKEENEWQCKVEFGAKKSFNCEIPSEALIEHKKILFQNDLADSPFDEFEVGIPVFHKNNLLAVVFLGGVADSSEKKLIENHLNFIQALTNIIMVAIENKKMARAKIEQEVYAKEMEIAKKVQQLLFPKTLPDQENFKIAAHYSPHNTVGGDYYDWLEIDEHRKIVCIADVSGKGVPAALLMSNFQASLRTLLRKTSDLEEIIKDLNYQVFQSADGENFITFFMALIDAHESHITYVNAGHNPPFLMNADGIKELDKGTLVLGAFEELPFLEIGHLDLKGEQTMFLYTDGLTEAFNDQEEEFGAEKVEAFLQKNKTATPTLLISELLKKLDDFVGDRAFSDDITLLVCDFNV